MSEYLMWNLLCNLFSMNVCNEYNLDLIHSPCCHCFVTYAVSCAASLPITTPLPWPHGKVKCPADVHFRISEVVGHPGAFRVLFYE